MSAPLLNGKLRPISGGSAQAVSAQLGKGRRAFKPVPLSVRGVQALKKGVKKCLWDGRFYAGRCAQAQTATVSSPADRIGACERQRRKHTSWRPISLSWWRFAVCRFLRDRKEHSRRPDGNLLGCGKGMLWHSATATAENSLCPSRK